ncbi:hypothetical protein SAMN05444920_103250 [Nonomuraea solani]|uniref:Uncharacterized protein n=1 Tax=Nonomuraea solani TaxID=1144553 RepID=A0A1H6BA05_9ACTN|nr:hypothetical protein SAMN05444920_103250 [Nonomuraea solani]
MASLPRRWRSCSEPRRAEGLLVQRCTARQGFRHWPPGSTRAPGTCSATSPGPASTATEESCAAKDPNDSSFNGLSKERRTRYNAEFGGVARRGHAYAAPPDGGQGSSVNFTVTFLKPSDLSIPDNIALVLASARVRRSLATAASEIFFSASR